VCDQLRFGTILDHTIQWNIRTEAAATSVRVVGKQEVGLLLDDTLVVWGGEFSNPVHVHDLQATILRCLGIDHLKLTYKYQGRHFRLTDVHGEVVKDLLA